MESRNLAPSLTLILWMKSFRNTIQIKHFKLFSNIVLFISLVCSCNFECTKPYGWPFKWIVQFTCYFDSVDEILSVWPFKLNTCSSSLTLYYNIYLACSCNFKWTKSYGWPFKWNIFGIGNWNLNFSIPLTTSVKKFKDFSNTRKEYRDNYEERTPAKFTQVLLDGANAAVNAMKVSPVVAWFVRFLSEFC